MVLNVTKCGYAFTTCCCLKESLYDKNILVLKVTWILKRSTDCKTQLPHFLLGDHSFLKLLFSLDTKG